MDDAPEIDRYPHRHSSSHSSGVVSVDAGSQIRGDAAEGCERSAISVCGASYTATESITKNVDASRSASNQLSKSGESKENSSFGKLAAKFLDDRVPLKKKLKWLNRLAIVKNDGTVQFDVPEDIKPHRLDFGTGVIHNGTTGEEYVDTAIIQDLPPLEIAMLIVGTRGDVQPFVAIGKRLQIW